MKELIEHIRTVHFTVLVLALVMMAALQLQPNHSLQRAADDAQAILQLASHRDAVDASISRSADITINGLQEQTSAGATSLYWPKADAVYSVLITNAKNPQLTQRMKFYTTTRWVWIGAVREKGGGWGKERLPMGVFPVPRTLSDFFWIWDQTKESMLGLYAIVLQDPTEKDGCHDLQEDSVGRPYGNWDGGALEFSILPLKDPDIVTIQPVVTDHVTACSFAPRSGLKIDIDFPQAFGRVAPRAAYWGNGSSSEVFPELSAAAHHLEDTPLDQVAKILQERADEEPERIEIFEAKLPLSTIPSVGGFLLVVCEIYLLAHLSELLRLLRSQGSTTANQDNLPSGYIGLYRSRLLFVFTFLSLSVWPFLPFCVAWYENTGAPIQVTVPFSVAAVVLGIASAMKLTKIRGLLAG